MDCGLSGRRVVAAGSLLHISAGAGLSDSFPILVGLLSVGLIVTLVLAWYHGEQGHQRVSGPELMIIACAPAPFDGLREGERH